MKLQQILNKINNKEEIMLTIEDSDTLSLYITMLENAVKIVANTIDIKLNDEE